MGLHLIHHLFGTSARLGARRCRACTVRDTWHPIPMEGKIWDKRCTRYASNLVPRSAVGNLGGGYDTVGIGRIRGGPVRCKLISR